ncbi:MAG: TIGR02266 family protein [Myxococcaceae bacterium]|nr:TIGR02266 family protein [Myxococcaceae bacterium]
MPRHQTALAESPLEREQQLRFAEQEIASKEAQLAQEVARLQSAAGELLARLQHIRAAASQVQLQGMRDPEFTQLHQRVHQAQVRPLDVTAAWERSLSARTKAVEVRREAAEEIHQTVQVHAMELSRLSSQLTADEAAMATFEAKAREAAQPSGAVTIPDGPRAPEAPRATPAPARDERTTQVTRPQGRRAQSRVRMQAAVDLHSESNFFTGFSTNISEGGLFVATVQIPPIGTEVDLSFTLPKGQKIQVKGVVRWTREVNDRTPEIFPGVGIQFVGLDPQTAEVIHRFVAEREPMFFPE